MTKNTKTTIKVLILLPIVVFSTWYGAYSLFGIKGLLPYIYGFIGGIVTFVILLVASATRK